jgi:hypothetical protein
MIYAYCRVSTAKQLDGLSMSLQDDKKLLEELAQKYNTTVSDRVYSDKGHSAFTGKNLDNELGQMIKDIEEGRIKAGDIIVMRHLDRLSRLSLTDVMPIYSHILKRKVKIYTTINNFLYESGTNNEAMGYLLATLAFATANEESVKKSYLTNRHALERITQFQNGVRTPCGHSFDLGIGSTPFYIQVEHRAVKQHPQNFSIAKELVNYALAGNGLHRCVKWLKEKYKIDYSKAGIAQLLKSETLIGTLKVNLQDRNTEIDSSNTRITQYETKEYLLEGFYPAVCTKFQYFTLQGMLKGKRRSDGNRKRYTLLAGRKFLKCGCGSSMVANHTSGKGAVYYTCINSDCFYSIKIHVLDSIVVRLLGAYFLKERLEIDDTQLKYLTEILESKSKELDSQRTFMLEKRGLFDDEYVTSILKPLIDEVSSLKKQVVTENNKITSSNLKSEDLKGLGLWAEKYEEIMSATSEQKKEHQEMICKVVSNIKVHSDGLVEVCLVNGRVKYVYLPKQNKRTGRCFGFKLNVFEDANDQLYKELKSDPNFHRMAFTTHEVKEKAYQCDIGAINESLLNLYSEEHTRFTALERFVNKIFVVEDILGYYILNKKFAMTFIDETRYSISEKQWQSYKSKCKPMLIAKSTLYCLYFISEKGNKTKEFVICSGNMKRVYSKLIEHLNIKEIISCTLVE